MSESIFFRLLKTPIDDKGVVLASQVAELNATGEAEEAYTLDPVDFSQIPGSPFAYWVEDPIRRLFVKLPAVESAGRAVRVGDHPGSHDRYVRLFWEVPAAERSKTRQWLPYQKGGAYSPYYYDIHLVADWDLDRETYYDFHGRPGRSSEHPSNYQFFFRPGLTWPRRTGGFSVRTLPSGCIFADKGPTAFVPKDDADELMLLLAVMNSTPFEMLVRVQLARTELAQSYEVGLIQNTPVPSLADVSSSTALSALAREAHDLQRDQDRVDETTHAFCLPGPVRHRNGAVLQGAVLLETEVHTTQDRLVAIQAEIDDRVFDLYGLGEADREMVRHEMGSGKRNTENAEEGTEHTEEEREDLAPPADLPVRVQSLLMWCVGVAYGRWDVRKALDPGLLPPVGGPFDPLPRCAPGALVNVEGMPASRDEVGDYPLSIAWDGILVDDPTHPSDIVARVRQVLALLWEDRAGDIEREVCQILGVKTLRDYFCDPRKGFFPFHIKRYSKSRRKAPIYWLLQSTKRSYAIWLYYHRMTQSTLYTAARSYADPKVKLEETRLVELRQALDALSGAARRRREREIERQDKLVAEVTEFRDRLDALALLNLPPDLNDGVVISIAPLRELVPWVEAQRMWDGLVAGEYDWSTMSRQMRERGLVQG